MNPGKIKPMYPKANKKSKYRLLRYLLEHSMGLNPSNYMFSNTSCTNYNLHLVEQQAFLQHQHCP